MGIQWNSTQVQIYEALQAGKSYTEIVKELNVTKPLITKVSNAVEQGDYPDKPKPEPVIHTFMNDPGTPKPGSKADQAQVIKQAEIAEAQEQGVHTSVNEVEEGDEEGEEEETKPYLKTKSKAKHPLTAPPELATILKLTPVSATVALTPIMQSMRLLCVMELGWSPSMSWEDIIDTCFYHLAKAWGFTLQGYYRDEPNDQHDSPKPAGGEPSGNGNGLSMEFSEAEIKLGMLAAKFIQEAAAKEMATAGSK